MVSLEEHINRLKKKIVAVKDNLVLSREHDFDKLDHVLSGDDLPTWTTAFRSFSNDDPHCRRGSWFSLSSPERVLGTMAVKVVEAVSIKDEINTLRVWDARGTPCGWKVEPLDYYLNLTGRWSFGGRLWLHPSVRGTGLSTWMTLLIRAQMAFDYNTAGHFCFLAEPLAENKLDLRLYLYPRPAIPALTIFSPAGDKYNIRVNHITRDEMNAEIET